MKRYCTEQCVDILRRQGHPVDRLTHLKPLKDTEVVERGGSVVRQAFEARYEGGTVERFYLKHGEALPLVETR